MTSFLLLRVGALGDLLLLAPALAALRARFPRARLTLVGHGEACRMLAAASLVDAGLSQEDPRLLELFSTPDSSAAESLWIGKIDLGIAWLADEDGTVAANLRRLGAKLVLVAPSAPPQGSGTHITDHLLDSLAPLGISSANATFGPLLSAPANEVEWARNYLAPRTGTRTLKGAPTGATLVPHDRARRIVAIHPGSGSPSKNWPAKCFAEVAVKLAWQEAMVPLLISGPADELALGELLSHLKCRATVARDLPLSRLAALLSLCDAYVGNDSGVTHLAALLGVPTVALFGPTDPAVWAPRGLDVTVMRWAGEPGSLPPEVVAETVARAALHSRKA
ncbi:MAG: glycosyltransferase family 9 protein [Chloroflexi bacterium]|nr:glycosyltransferase family 9 protein [Chloroflexota bacterium]